MALLPVPEVVKEMAGSLESISKRLDSQGKQMEQIRGQMVTTEQFKALEGKLGSIVALEAGFKAMQSEVRALLKALDRK